MTTVVAHSGEMKRAIIKALGLEGRMLQKITITLGTVGPIRVEVEELATEDAMANVTRVLESATWTEDEPSGG